MVNQIMEGKIMKKTIIILLVAALATALVGACGAGGSYGGYDNSSYAAPQAAPAAEAEMPMSDMDFGYVDSDAAYPAGSGESGTDATPISAPAAEEFAEKIIYTVYADIETMKFDESLDRVDAMLAIFGGFVESSSISGINYASDYYGWNEYRYAHFILRIPKERLDAITADLGSLGNVINRTSNAENITAQFYDVQSRLNSLRVQEERLLEMLAKAEDVPDLIVIEERLGEVRYQIESLMTTLNNWQRQVDYSTLTLSIREVESFTEFTELNRSYWQQIGDGFMSTLKGVGNFFMAFFKWLIVSAPVLLILAAIAVVVFIFVRRSIRSNKSKQSVAAKSPPVGAMTTGYVSPYAPPYTPPYTPPYDPPSTPESDPEKTPEKAPESDPDN